ncbi:MAG TPA: NifU family protein [Bacteroidia bacterium]|nr:NifU family protein [Bacteroidia bacterium]
MENTLKMPVALYAESTPNPSAMKFVANILLIEEGATAQYQSKAETKDAPLAAKLFEFPFVKNIFFNANYITVTKTDAVSWDDIVFELREFIKQYISEGKKIISELPKQEMPADSSFKNTTSVYTEHVVPQTEMEAKIIEILDQYIRPAVEGDGGLITFKSFKDGVVEVVLKGSCSGCPSSTLTLKAGIEALLKKMIPSVTEVVAEAA